MQKTALVLSAGGMFGAYQAGVWKAIAPVFQPDMVVGASIGALNGWVIAGGSQPDRLIETWLDLDPLSRYRWRFPRRIRHGFIDSRPVEHLVEDIFNQYQPQIPFGVVCTDTLRLRPVLFQGPDITWQHLAASAAILGFFKQHRIHGRSYSDGGLLKSSPVWAAVQMGAERIVSVNCLTNLPSFVMKKTVGTIRRVRRFRPEIPDSVEVIHISAPPLGTAKEALYWTRENAARWIELGFEDGQAAINEGKFDEGKHATAEQGAAT